jgi:hypothetical protein
MKRKKFAPLIIIVDEHKKESFRRGSLNGQQQQLLT